MLFGIKRSFKSMLRFRGLKIVLMIVENSLQENLEIFTLCYQDKRGDLNPIVDFKQPEHAKQLADTLNQSGHFIKLNDLSEDREILVYAKSPHTAKPLEKFPNLLDALSFLNIAVDFEVEPPEENINLTDSNLFFY